MISERGRFAAMLILGSGTNVFESDNAATLCVVSGCGKMLHYLPTRTSKDEEQWDRWNEG